MPNWKKLIVSGSDATLNSLTVTTSGSFYDDLTISGSNSSLIIKGDGNKFARITHDGGGLIIDGGVQNQYISIGSPTWNYPNGVKVYGDLEQTGSAGGTATFEGPTQSTLNLKTTTNSKNNYIVGTTAGNLSLRPNGSESLMLLANGNVGIGTSNPSSKLEVAGTVHASGSYLHATNDAADSVGLRLDSPGTGVNVNFEFEVGDTGISGLHSKNLVIRGSSSSSDIAFSPSSTYPGLMALDGSSGNVGIGTTSPGQKLDVSGNIRTNSNLYVYNSDLSRQTLRVHAETTTNTGILKLSNGSNWGLLMRGHGNGPYVGSYYAGSFNITGFEDSTGTSPSAINLASFTFGGTGGSNGYLTLNGDLKVYNNKKIQLGYNNGQTNGIEWYHGSAKISAAIVPVDTANFARTGLGFFTGDYSDGATNADERMRITREGNVGIGTTNPDSLLHVSADVSSAAVNKTGTITIEGRPYGILGDDIATIDFHNNGNKRSDIRMERGNTADDSQLVFSTSDTGTLTDRLIINEAGNVGIGTTNPTRKLNVNGNVGINNQLLLDSANYGEHLAIRRGVYGYDTIITGTRVDYSPTADTLSFKFLANLQTTGQLNVTDNAVIGGNISLTGGGTIEAPSSSGNEDLNLKAAGKIDVVIDSNGNSGDDQTFRVLKHSNSVLFTVAETGQTTVSGELEAASLDINGNADISGDLTVAGTSNSTRISYRICFCIYNVRIRIN